MMAKARVKVKIKNNNGVHQKVSDDRTLYKKLLYCVQDIDDNTLELNNLLCFITPEIALKLIEMAFKTNNTSEIKHIVSDVIEEWVESDMCDSNFFLDAVFDWERNVRCNTIRSDWKYYIPFIKSLYEKIFTTIPKISPQQIFRMYGGKHMKAIIPLTRLVDRDWWFYSNTSESTIKLIEDAIVQHIKMSWNPYYIILKRMKCIRTEFIEKLSKKSKYSFNDTVWDILISKKILISLETINNVILCDCTIKNILENYFKAIESMQSTNIKHKYCTNQMVEIILLKLKKDKKKYLERMEDMGIKINYNSEHMSNACMAFDTEMIKYLSLHHNIKIEDAVVKNVLEAFIKNKGSLRIRRGNLTKLVYNNDLYVKSGYQCLELEAIKAIFDTRVNMHPSYLIIAKDDINLLDLLKGYGCRLDPTTYLKLSSTSNSLLMNNLELLNSFEGGEMDMTSINIETMASMDNIKDFQIRYMVKYFNNDQENKIKLFKLFYKYQPYNTLLTIEKIFFKLSPDFWNTENTEYLDNILQNEKIEEVSALNLIMRNGKDHNISNKPHLLNRIIDWFSKLHHQYYEILLAKLNDIPVELTLDQTYKLCPPELKIQLRFYHKS